MKSAHSKKEVSPAIPSYRPRTELLTFQEFALYETLREIFDNKNEVLLKVNLAELVYIPEPDRHYLVHWHRVQRRRLDFLVCSLPMMRPVLAIKMETKAESKKRKKNDRDVLDTVLEDIQLPLLRLKARDRHEVENLVKQISFLLEETINSDSVGNSKSVKSIWSAAKLKCGLGGWIGSNGAGSGHQN